MLIIDVDNNGALPCRPVSQAVRGQNVEPPSLLSSAKLFSAEGKWIFSETCRGREGTVSGQAEAERGSVAGSEREVCSS